MLLLAGLLIGLLLGYLLSSLLGGGGSTANADPSNLAPTGQALWVNMSAESLELTGDANRVRAYMSVFTPDQQARLLGQEITVAQQAQDLERVRRLTTLGQVLNVAPVVPETVPGVGTPLPGTTTTTGDNRPLAQLLMFCGGTLIALLLLVGAAIIFTRARNSAGGPPAPRTRTPAGSRTRQRASVGEPSVAEPPLSLPTPTAARSEESDALDRLFDETADEVDVDSAPLVEAPPARASISAPIAEPPARPATYLPALDEFVTRYSYGDDGFDMSFSIENAQTEFLGECGVGISEVLNNGKPEQATAFEIWLFDKDDIRTVTKVLLSEYAWSNEELRTKLASKGELVPIRQGETVDLETKSLRVRARLREVEYGSGGVGRNAYFERLVIDLTPQQKQ